MTKSETQQRELSLEQLAKELERDVPKQREPLAILVVEPIEVKPKKRKRNRSHQ